MFIRILNWDRFNPKRAQKTYTWLRLNNDFMLQPEMTELDVEQKYVWICILCWASKKNKGDFKTTMKHMMNLTGVSEKKILGTLKTLKEWEVIDFNTTEKCSEPKNTQQNATPTRRDETDETNETIKETKSEYDNEERLINFWNKLDIVKHELSENNFKKVRKALKKKKDYSIEDIVKALRNFATALKGPSYWSHKWTLWELLTREHANQFFPDNFIPENFEAKNKLSTQNQSEYSNPYLKEVNVTEL